MSTTDDTHAKKSLLAIVKAFHASTPQEFRKAIDEAEAQAKMIDARRGTKKQDPPDAG